MNTIQQGIITLIRSSLTQRGLELPEGFDLEEALPEIRRHQLHAIAYDGAALCGIDKKLPVMQTLFQAYLKCMLTSERQMEAAERIFSAFDEAGIDYMPLKGCNLKALYPMPELRLMGDADILIKLPQYELIKPIMKKLGFEEKRESDHELIWDSLALHVELHKHLIPSYNPDYYSYFGDGWKLAKVRNGSRFGMKPEDEYIYLFTHFAKHYRDGGIGCRHVADLWVYRSAYPQLDGEYIESELRKLQLLEFHRNIEALVKFWFENAQPDEKTEFISDFIFGSGAWGERPVHILATVVKESKKTKNILVARLSRLWKLAFLPLFSMKQKYPILTKLPVLLPVFWVVRIVHILLFTRGKWTQHSQEFMHATHDEVLTYQQALNYVGLDFNFKD